MRLIDADRLYDEIEYDALFSVQTAKDVVELLFSAPTVDAVEVVFCENCILHENCHTEKSYKLFNIENPFCCAGKRKENE